MPPQKKARIESIDLLKGVVMVLMALDHTRDYFHQSSVLMDVTNPERASAALFIIRWITHFCAPAFSFLAGVSAFMSGKSKTKTALAAFLIKRGLWLVFLEITVISFAWYFDLHFGNIDLAVIWVLGVSMISLAAFIYLPLNAILIVSLLLIFGHNLLDPIHFSGSLLWSLIHDPASFNFGDGHTLNVVYPIIPWIGVMALGYYFGSFYSRNIKREWRQQLFNRIGIFSIVAFALIRWTNWYGDPKPWLHLANAGQTIMSFFNVNKYPPSLLYLLATLAFTFLFLANSEKWRGKLVDFFSVFGRVPFFYYLLHLYLIRISAMVTAELTGHGWEIMVQKQFDIDLKDFGFNLGIVCLVWITIVLALYPLCKTFDHYKQNHKDKWWLGYL